MHGLGDLFGGDFVEFVEPLNLTNQGARCFV